MTSTVELYDKAIISRQPNFDERKTRSEFRKVIPNLKTVVVHCFDPRVTGGIPPAVAKALPGQVYPGEVFEFVGEDGKKKIGSNTTIFPVVVAGGRASGSAQRSISIACHLFDIDNVAIVHHTDCGGTHFTPEGFLETFKESSGRTSRICGTPTILALKTSRSRYIATYEACELLAGRQGT
jgi:carbonic anhydrase